MERRRKKIQFRSMESNAIAQGHSLRSFTANHQRNRLIESCGLLQDSSSEVENPKDNAGELEHILDERFNIRELKELVGGNRDAEQQECDDEHDVFGCQDLLPMIIEKPKGEDDVRDIGPGFFNVEKSGEQRFVKHVLVVKTEECCEKAGAEEESSPRPVMPRKGNQRSSEEAKSCA